MFDLLYFFLDYLLQCLDSQVMELSEISFTGLKSILLREVLCLWGDQISTHQVTRVGIRRDDVGRDVLALLCVS